MTTAAKIAALVAAVKSDCTYPLDMLSTVESVDFLAEMHDEQPGAYVKAWTPADSAERATMIRQLAARGLAGIETLATPAAGVPEVRIHTTPGPYYKGKRVRGSVLGTAAYDDEMVMELAREQLAAVAA